MSLTDKTSQREAAIATILSIASIALAQVEGKSPTAIDTMIGGVNSALLALGVSEDDLQESWCVVLESQSE